MEPIEDGMWYRVAQLRPRLRLRVRVQRRVTRGRVWYLLADDPQRRFHRVDAAAYQFVGRLDGNATVDAAWRAVHQQLGEDAPTQGDVIRLLAQLSDAQLLAVSAFADLDAVLKQRRTRKQRLHSAIANPLSFKVPLFDPTRLLHWLLPCCRWAFGGLGLALWLLLVAAGLALALTRGDELQHALALHIRTAGFLFQMWAVYPLVKLVHEACHALAVRRWGGEVREVGVTLVMLTPLPYVDASAATGFVERRRRMAVSAVGVMAELAIATLALFVWAAASSSAVQASALAVCAACGLSTLLFNANPLARFDGYYLLSDWLDLPNLHQRGRAMVAHLAQRLCGAAAATVPETSRREAVMVVGYAVLAWLYQAVVVATLGYWLYEPYPLIAAGVLLAGGWALLGRPLGRSIGYLLLDSRLDGRRLRALAVGGGIAGACGLALFVVPAPSFTVQQGVVWTPPEAILRAETQGDLVTLFAHADDRVEAGQAIAELQNLALRSERESAAVKQLQLDIQYFDALLTQPLQAQQLALERDATRARVQRLEAQAETMTVRARAAGTLVVPRDTGQPGHFYRQGKELGYILSDAPGLLVKVALTEAQAAQVREHTNTVTVRLASAAQDELPASLDRETPSVTRTLPSAVLGSAAGGPIATQADDAEGRQTLSPVALVDVRVPGHRTDLIGARAWVRFDHPNEPLARQWTRALQQAFLSRLGAGS
jgi:putative peptide zinc metalloprotease protein